MKRHPKYESDLKVVTRKNNRTNRKKVKLLLVPKFSKFIPSLSRGTDVYRTAMNSAVQMYFSVNWSKVPTAPDVPHYLAMIVDRWTWGIEFGSYPAGQFARLMKLRGHIVKPAVPESRHTYDHQHWSRERILNDDVKYMYPEVVVKIIEDPGVGEDGVVLAKDFIPPMLYGSIPHPPRGEMFDKRTRTTRS